MFGVLGPVVAWDGAGDLIALKGPQHRAVLARLIVARGRVVPVNQLVDDLWVVPPAGAIGAVRTFVGALRRAVEPERPPRAPARLLVTEGPGYALRAEPDAVDAWRFEEAVVGASTLTPEDALARLQEALSWWRGPAYAEFADDSWALAERSRLAELRLHAVEQLAESRLALGLAAEAVPDLDAHVTEHPWREDAWRLLALALYRTDRQGDALAVLRRARALLVEQLGVDPGPELRRLETDILNQSAHLRPAANVNRARRRDPAADLDPTPDAAERVWSEATAAYDRAAGTRARLESTVGLLRNLAVTGGGGLQAAREHRVAAISAAEELDDPELTARVIGAYDVPAIWTRSDDPDQAAWIVEAAERTLQALSPREAKLPGEAGASGEATPAGARGGVGASGEAGQAGRVRLLATVAVESRGVNAVRAGVAATEAVGLARRLEDPGLLAFALNGLFTQTFSRAGLAPRRDEIGAELIALSSKHGLATFEILGHLIRLQARSALADFSGADEHARAADQLGAKYESPLVTVFTQWYRALRLSAGGAPANEVQDAYRKAAALLDNAGMPGLQHGLLPLALLSVRLQHGLPAQTDEHWGPYEPWIRPLVLLGQSRDMEAAVAVREAPEPPHDLLYEAMWSLIARAAVAVGDRQVMRRARTALRPAAGELAGAGSGLLTFGPVSDVLETLAPEEGD